MRNLKIGLFLVVFFTFASFGFAANCWELNTAQAACENSSDTLNCVWKAAGQDWCPSDSTGCCEQLGCWNYDGDKTTCQAATDLGCTWESNQYGQKPWCPVSPSNPFLFNGTQVSGVNIGCCSMPGCWDNDGSDQSTCEDSGFMDGVCVWKTQAEDPYCPDSVGCCMMPFCNDVSTEADCDFLVEKGMPCSWSGSACSDPGFSGFDGADSCINNGGFWNGSDCEMPTFNQEVHCWFADFKPTICLNITGCVYCDSSNTVDDMSACYNNQLGWCQGHENPWINDGAAGLVNDIAVDNMECADIQLQGVCDCGPLPGCHWSNSSAVTGNFCEAGVSQCNLNTDDLVYQQCSDAPNQSVCDELSNNYFMPCIFNLSGTSVCEFDWQSGGGFGDDKGDSDFDFYNLESELACGSAGGFWKVVDIDSYGNTESWCEFGFGQNTEECENSCWACEYQDDGTHWASLANAQSACTASAAGGSACNFVSFGSQSPDGRWGWCDFPMEMNFFGGGNCEDSCFDCFNTDMCTNSAANCSWVNDPMGFGPGWCDPAAVAQFMNCSINPLACMGQFQCESNGYNWTSDYVSDPFSNFDMWVCIENGSTPEICFVPGDEDDDNDSDCMDSDCNFDPMCGFGMGDMGPGSMGGGMMLPDNLCEALCFAFDDTNQSACEATIFKQSMDFNGSHRGHADLPVHMNNTQVCFYHTVTTPFGNEDLCDPVFEQQMMGGMDMGKPPAPIGKDPSGDANNLDYLDIVHIGIMDDPQTMDISIPLLNISDFAVCNNKLNGTSNGTIYRYIDSDTNESSGCTATDGTYDGFDYKLVVSSTYDGSDVSTITAAYRCVDSVNNIWATKSASLTLMDDACYASPPPFAPDFMSFSGVNVLVFKKSDFGIATSDLRILVATAGPDNNESSPTDEAGPFYYTPGSIDFMMEDCFGFVDMDGDGLKPAQDPDCKFIKSIGFIPFEDCGNSIDDDGDNLVDCLDPQCSFTPKCSGGSFNYAPDSSDTTAPNVVFHKVDTFFDGAFVMFDTNEPANGSVLFYGTSSGCDSLNVTLNDLGDPAWSYDDYKPFHHVPLDNFAGNINSLGYDLVNSTTYYYKYKVCDPSSNCALSACANFTTESSMSNFYFSATPPSGFEVPNPWGSGDLGYAKAINSSVGKNTNLTINCPTSGYSLTLVGIDAKAAKEIDLSDLVCDATNDVIGMGSDTWNQLLFDLSVDSVIITWNTGGDSAVVEHCDDSSGTTSCKDVTSYLDCTVTASTVTCKIPVTLGFSSYKLTTSTTTTTTTSSSGGSSSSGGIASSSATGIYASYFFVQLSTGQLVEMVVNKDSLAITKNTFVVSGPLAGVTVTSSRITNESLAPALLSNVYQYLKVEADGMSDSDYSSASLQFSVSKSWLAENNADPFSVQLKYFEGVWQDLATVLVSEGSEENVYSASVPKFTDFAVVFTQTLAGEPVAEAPVPEAVAEPVAAPVEEVTGAVVAEEPGQPVNPAIPAIAAVVLIAIGVIVFVLKKY